MESQTLFCGTAQNQNTVPHFLGDNINKKTTRPKILSYKTKGKFYFLTLTQPPVVAFLLVTSKIAGFPLPTRILTKHLLTNRKWSNHTIRHLLIINSNDLYF